MEKMISVTKLKNMLLRESARNKNEIENLQKERITIETGFKCNKIDGRIEIISKILDFIQDLE
jgi:hypothetical protein